MKKYILAFSLILSMFSVHGQRTELGTEIWIEPGNSKAQITEWVKLASEAKFKSVRIFLMWTHVEPELDKWDYQVYDWMFKACEKYNIKLQVTLFANQPAYHYGKEFWSRIQSHRIFSETKYKEAAAKYIRKTVERYKDSPVLENWWLMNEPYPFISSSPIVVSGFQKEMKGKYGTIENLNNQWKTNFTSFETIDNVPEIYEVPWSTPAPYYDWVKYCNKHLTNFQKWVRDEVLKYDTRHSFHTNPGAHLSYSHKQESTEWRPFLNSLGASIHPSWHFDIFKKEQYSMAVAASCEITKSNASPNSFWVSELSGGDNLFRYGPDAKDIAQWTWTGIAQGAEKIIYWLLNRRTSGQEAGEWGLLSYQNTPTDRLETATKIADCLDQEHFFFDHAKPIESNITILVSRETNLTYDRKKMEEPHNKSFMACYEALAERGIKANIQQTNDFQWAKSSGQAIILPNILTLPEALVDSIKVFLQNKNKMIVLGPTAYYDEQENCRFMNFPFKNEFGAEPEDIQSCNDRFQLSSDDGKYNFDAYNLLVTIRNYTATPVCRKDGFITGVRNKTGRSELVWIPSGIAIGAWLYDNTALSQFLYDELSTYTTNQPFEFTDQSDHVCIQTMYNGDRYLTVINNGNKKSAEVVQLRNKENKKPVILFCTDKDRKKAVDEKPLVLSPGECLVLLWE